MKTAIRQQPAATAPQRRVRQAPKQPPDGAVSAVSAVGADGASGAATTAPQSDTETRDAQIHRLAYARYVSNGCVDGRALDDWLAAEAEFAALGQGGEASGRRSDT